MSWFQQAFSSQRQRREQATFNKLYRELAPRLFRRLVAKGYAQALVEEALHEAFLAYWQKCHAPVLRGEPTPANVNVEAPYSWLLRIAQNKVIDAYRKASTAQEHKHSAEKHAQAAPSGESALVTRELLQQVLAQLSTRDVELLLLREAEGLSYDELAAQLSLERGSVGTLLRRARQAFQEAHTALLDEKDNAKDSA